MKFRKHNVEHAIEEANERSHKAASKSDLWTNVWWAEGVLFFISKPYWNMAYSIATKT